MQGVGAMGPRVTAYSFGSCARVALAEEEISRLGEISHLHHSLEMVSRKIQGKTKKIVGSNAFKVTVVGGEAGNPDMLQLLSDQVNVPFRIGKPMQNIALEPALGDTDRRTGQPEWGTALGLALKPTHEAMAVAS